MGGQTREAFSLFVEENQNKFYRLAYSYVENKDEALDIVQDAIVRALRKLHTLRQPAYMRTWFYRVLVNESLDHLRRKKRQAVCLPLEEMLLVDSAPPVSSAAELLSLIEGLAPELKTVVFLRFYEDMKLSEIAEVTGENLNTVKSRLYRALRLLRATLTEEETQ